VAAGFIDNWGKLWPVRAAFKAGVKPAPTIRKAIWNFAKSEGQKALAQGPSRGSPDLRSWRRFHVKSIRSDRGKGDIKSGYA